MSFDDREALRARLAQLEQQVAAKDREIEQLKKTARASEVAETPVAISEFEDTLKRLVQRIAMILQAEKCVIMVLDKDSGELVARNPAYGMSEGDVRSLRVKVTDGIAGEVFRSERPSIFHDALHDPRTVKESVAYLHINNGVVVPIIVEKRDEENRVMERITIGVLSVFNKRYGGQFIEEDVQLLDRLARSAAAVIANAQMFQEIIEEKEKLVHTIESLYAGLMLIGGNGKVIQMNARARQIFNVQADPMAKTYKDIINHEKACEILSRMLSYEAASNQSDEEEDTRAAEEISVADPETDEERIFQMHSAMVRGEDGHLIGTAVILNDIT